MRRLLSFCLLAAALLMLPATSASAVTVGVSDQQAATFTSPLFKPLKMKAARYIAPYDVMQDSDQRARMDEWITAARAAKQRVLISFEHSRLPGKERRVPSASAFKKEMKAFKAEYGGSVEAISPWNEVNRCQTGGRTEGQPQKICRVATGPKITAGYYKVARSVFKGKKIVALDVLDGQNVGGAVQYIKKFRRYAKPTPKYWGLHNYSDTNRKSNVRTGRMIKAIGNRRAEIWLTETGGQLKLGSRTFGEAKAAKALKCMFSMPKTYKQIKRLYIYQFHGAQPSDVFDAGLVEPDLTTKRKGWDVVKKRQSAKCRS